MKDYSTKEISNELTMREGVTPIHVEPYEKFIISTGQGEREFTGPAIIIVNQD